jgi:hypothetical protein
MRPAHFDPLPDWFMAYKPDPAGILVVSTVISIKIMP